MTGRTENGGHGTPRLRNGHAPTSWDNLPPANPPPTGEEFDALTDLFLGEVGHGVAASTPQAPESTAGARPGRSQPVLRLAGAADDLELDDAPPSPPVAAAKPPPGFGGDVAPIATQERPHVRKSVSDAPSAIVECIVLGHLPVLAAAWAAQYVREIAAASGKPVAYLRLQRDSTSVELIGGDGGTTALPSESSLQAALRVAAEQTDRWVVRADPGEEASLAANPLVRVVTVLTGVDEAAVVAAYSSVKALSASLGTVGVDSAAPIIRVAAMGAAHDKAMPAAKRLADSIARFIGRDVDTAVCSARIASARPSEVLFSGRTELSPAEAMEALMDAASESAGAPRPARVPVAPRPALRIDEELIRIEREPQAAPQEFEAVSLPVETVIAERPPAPASLPRASLPDTSELDTREAADDLDSERAEVTRDEPTALALLLPGLRPVSVRCPYAEGIEFAVDRSGTVHLLSRLESGDDAGSVIAGEQRALSELLVAGAWADAHSHMLAAALGQSAGLAASGMTPRAELHLFTDRPKASRRLLETSVNVHLLARVKVGGESGWFCTDLN